MSHYALIAQNIVVWWWAAHNVVFLGFHIFQLVRKNGLEFTEWFEHLIPLKLKEEVASCFVNLHERSGTAASFLTDLVVREVSSLGETACISNWR